MPSGERASRRAIEGVEEEQRGSSKSAILMSVDRWIDQLDPLIDGFADVTATASNCQLHTTPSRSALWHRDSYESEKGEAEEVRGSQTEIIALPSIGRQPSLSSALRHREYTCAPIAHPTHDAAAALHDLSCVRWTLLQK